MQLPQFLQHYLGTTYRRKLLDTTLNNHRDLFHGSVLDIGGGRKRGSFLPPKNAQWTFADITPELAPDVICDVADMPFEDATFDVIKATELFEHVRFPENGIAECYRVLKKGGTFVVSMPFLYPIHGDPSDYQRWTHHKWQDVTRRAGFATAQVIPIGHYFTVLCDMLKSLNKSLPLPLRLLGYTFYPALDIMQKLDTLQVVQNNPILNKYTTGYVFIFKKDC